MSTLQLPLFLRGRGVPHYMSPENPPKIPNLTNSITEQDRQSPTHTKSSHLQQQTVKFPTSLTYK